MSILAQRGTAERGGPVAQPGGTGSARGNALAQRPVVDGRPTDPASVMWMTSAVTLGVELRDLSELVRFLDPSDAATDPPTPRSHDRTSRPGGLVLDISIAPTFRRRRHGG